MNRTTISVIIPTLNRPRSLARAVDSVQRQTRLPDEIIVVDDGSDPPVDVQAFADSAIPIRLVRNTEVMGAAAARNIGVSSATGSFVAFIDDDDTWFSTKLAHVAGCIADCPDVDVVIHRTGYVAQAPTTPPSCSSIAEPIKRMTRSGAPHLDGVVVRRSVHLDSPFDERLIAAEDIDYLIRLARSDVVMVESSAVLAVFGEDEPSAISIESRIECRLALLARYPEILADSKAKAFFYIRLGHLQLRHGKRGTAARSFAKSIWTRPASRTAWKGIVHCLLPLK